MCDCGIYCYNHLLSDLQCLIVLLTNRTHLLSGVQSVIVVFPDHTHLQFASISHSGPISDPLLFSKFYNIIRDSKGYESQFIQ